MVEHRSKAKADNNIKIYNAMKELGIENFNIILIENYPCNNKEELLSRENYNIRLYDTIKNGYNGVIAIIDEERKD